MLHQLPTTVRGQPGPAHLSELAPSTAWRGFMAPNPHSGAGLALPLRAGPWAGQAGVPPVPHTLGPCVPSLALGSKGLPRDGAQRGCEGHTEDHLSLPPPQAGCPPRGAKTGMEGWGRREVAKASVGRKRGRRAGERVGGVGVAPEGEAHGRAPLPPVPLCPRPRRAPSPPHVSGGHRHDPGRRPGRAAWWRAESPRGVFQQEIYQ